MRLLTLFRLNLLVVDVSVSFNLGLCCCSCGSTLLKQDPKSPSYSLFGVLVRLELFVFELGLSSLDSSDFSKKSFGLGI